MAAARSEGKTIRDIRQASLEGRLGPIFSATDVNTALGIRWAGTFLPKHRVGNPGGYTELFLQVNYTPALYSLIVDRESVQ